MSTRVSINTVNTLSGGVSLSHKMLLTSTGDGTGVSTISLTVSKDIRLTLDGTARFYSDSAGTLDESTTWTVTAGGTRTRYLKCPSGTANLTFSDRTKLIQWAAWTSSTNAASLGGDISKFVNLNYIYILGSNTLSGDISGLTLLTYILILGTNILSGDISGMTSLTYVDVRGHNILAGSVAALTSLTRLNIQGYNTVSGSVAALTSLTCLYITGSNTVSGSVAALTSLTWLAVTGSNTLSGDINPIVNGITYLYLPTCAMIDYTSGATWSNATVTINPAVGYGYDSTEIDNILIDMDNSAVFSGKTITLQGSSAARTTNSDTAVNDLVAAGNTVITN